MAIIRLTLKSTDTGQNNNNFVCQSIGILFTILGMFKFGLSTNNGAMITKTLMLGAAKFFLLPQPGQICRKYFWVKPYWQSVVKSCMLAVALNAHFE